MQEHSQCFREKVAVQKVTDLVITEIFKGVAQQCDEVFHQGLPTVELGLTDGALWLEESADDMFELGQPEEVNGVVVLRRL